MANNNFYKPKNHLGKDLLSISNIDLDTANISTKIPYILNGRIPSKYLSQTKSVTLPADTVEANITTAINTAWGTPVPSIGDIALVTGCTDGTLNATWTFTTESKWVKYGSAGSVVDVVGSEYVTVAMSNGIATISLNTIKTTELINSNVDPKLSLKQNILIAGAGISITGDTIAANPQFIIAKVNSVSELPVTGNAQTIYLVPNAGSGNNIFDEYLWIDTKYELFGTTEVSLSNYYTKSETDTQITNKVDTKISTVVKGGSNSGLAIVTDATKNVTITLTTSNKIDGTTDTPASELAVSSAVTSSNTFATNSITTAINAIKGTKECNTRAFASSELVKGVLTLNSILTIINVVGSDKNIIMPSVNYTETNTIVTFFDEGEEALAYGGIFNTPTNSHTIKFASITI